MIPRTAVVIVCASLAAVIAACGGKQQGDVAHESASSGSLTMYVDESLTRLAGAEIAAYDSIFPAVKLTAVQATAREAVVKLLSGDSKLILLGRPLLKDERDLVAKYNITLGEYELAKSAVAIAVNRANPVDTMSVATVRAVCEGSISSWNAVGGGTLGGIAVCIPSPATSTYQNLAASLGGLTVKTAALVSDTTALLLDRVRRDKRAVAPVAWSVVAGDTTVKLLRIAGVDSTGKPTSPTMIHPAYIYLKRYPLLHSVYGYTTEGRPALAKGFLAFVSNADGQRLALAQQLVPATQIIRLREPE